MPPHPAYRRQVLDHLGRVAGMVDELGIGDVLDHATHQTPDLRDRTGGEAVNAMGRQGLGGSNQALSRVPRFFQKTPPFRRLSPRVAPAQLHDEARGRALEPLYAYGVPERYRLMAATAAERRGLTPRVAPRDRPSSPGAGR